MWTPYTGERVRLETGDPAIKYISASGHSSKVYLLQDDGAVAWHPLRTLDGSAIIVERTGVVIKRGVMSPPVGVKYTAVSPGHYATYLVRDDGMVDCTHGKGRTDGTLVPPKGTQYVDACGGHMTSRKLEEGGGIRLLD